MQSLIYYTGTECGTGGGGTNGVVLISMFPKVDEIRPNSSSPIVDLWKYMLWLSDPRAYLECTSQTPRSLVVYPVMVEQMARHFTYCTRTMSTQQVRFGCSSVTSC